MSREPESMEIYQLSKREQKILFNFLATKTVSRKIDDPNFKRDLLIFNIDNKRAMWRAYVQLYRLSKVRLLELGERLGL